MIFIGPLYRLEEESNILELSKGLVSNASNKFQWNLLDGIEQITNVEIINVIPVGIYPSQYKKFILKTNFWKWRGNVNNIEIGAINIPVLKQLSRYIRIKKELKKRIINDKDILIYSTYLPILKAVTEIDTELNVTIIVPDLPEFADLNKSSMFRKVLRKLNNFYVNKYLKKINKFVILTEQMKHPLNLYNKSYLVVEGIGDNYVETNYSEDNRNNNDKKIILYTGTLHYRYGIGNLLQAFNLINDENYELWICGKGEASKEIQNMAKLNKRIKFFGFQSLKEVRKKQKKATILVNPRTNEGDYVKYSFPSKTLEYLSIGKPVLMFKLEGIPTEYDNYLHYFKSEKPHDMAASIKNLCEKSRENLKEIGENGRRFVLENKSPIAQATKILDFIEQDM